MNLLIEKQDLVYLYACQKLQDSFLDEGIKAWDKLEGVLPHYGDFLNAYLKSRWKSFFKNAGNN